ncbi:protein SPO16 homolog [Discoglossus pictus]
MYRSVTLELLNCFGIKCHLELTSESLTTRFPPKPRSQEQEAVTCSLPTNRTALQVFLMAEGSTSWTSTVIMSSSMRDHEVTSSLQNQHHKVRFSESVESGIIIFSLSGIAFLLTNAEELLATSIEALFDRIEKFISVHRNCFLVIAAALHGPIEWNLMFNIQQRFLGSNLRIIPAHNSADMVKIMLTIAKVTSKPHIESIRDRLLMAKEQIVEDSPVWKALDSI